jgi:gluconokinase
MEALEETCGPIELVHVNGGFVQSPEWLQILADVLGKDLAISATREASATGAAYMAMQALGKPLTEIAPGAPGEQEALRRIHPNPTTHQVYDRLVPVFQDLYTKLHPEFVRLP